MIFIKILNRYPTHLFACVIQLQDIRAPLMEDMCMYFVAVCVSRSHFGSRTGEELTLCGIGVCQLQTGKRSAVAN